MNKIFNWTFGSLFRTFGRFFAYLILSICLGLVIGNLDKDFLQKIINLLGIDYVYAMSNDEVWGLNLSPLVRGDWFDCSSSDTCDTSLPTTNVGLSSEVSYIAGDTSRTIGSNGNLIGLLYGNNLDSDYLYSAKVYICSTVNLSNVSYDLYATNYSNRAINTLQYSSGTNRGSMSPFVYDTSTVIGGYCYVYSSVFQVSDSINSNWIYLRLKDSNNTVTNFTPAIIGYEIESLGISTNAIEKVLVNNLGGVATAQDLQNVEESINQQTIESTNEQIESQKVCSEKRILSIITNSDFTNSNDTIGSLVSSSGSIFTGSTSWKVTDFISVSKNDVIYITRNFANVPSTMFCIYDNNKSFIKCSNDNVFNVSQDGFVRINYNGYNLPIIADIKNCKNGNQAITDSINDDDVNSSTNEASDFFEDFTTDTHGLTGIITAPLNAINSLTSATCSPLVLPLPYVNQDLTLPCMRTIYETNFGDFMTLYDVITLGIISYWVSIRIFNLVKDFKNPEHDEIEVMDL